MVRERHPEVADMIVDALDSDPSAPIFSAIVEAARAVQVGNFEPPSWASLSHGARDEFEPGCSRRTWQHPAPKPCTVTRGSCPDSQTTSGQCCVPRAAQDLVWHCRPSSAALRIDSHDFGVLLLRRLRLSLHPVSRCWCGRLLDPFGHHRAACSRAGA